MNIKTLNAFIALLTLYSISVFAADTSSRANTDTTDTSITLSKQADGKLIFLPPHDPLCAIGLTNVGNANIQEFALLRTLGRAAVIMYVNGPQHKSIAKRCFWFCQELVENDTSVTRLLDDQVRLFAKINEYVSREGIPELVCILYDNAKQKGGKAMCLHKKDNINASLINQPLFAALLSASGKEEFSRTTQVIANAKHSDLYSAVQFARDQTEGKAFGPALVAILDHEKLARSFKKIPINILSMSDEELEKELKEQLIEVEGDGCSIL